MKNDRTSLWIPFCCGWLCAVRLRSFDATNPKLSKAMKFWWASVAPVCIEVVLIGHSG